MDQYMLNITQTWETPMIDLHRLKVQISLSICEKIKRLLRSLKNGSENV